MQNRNRAYRASSARLAAVTSLLLAGGVQATELTGFAMLPANTFAVGPTSGQFAGPGAGGNSLPLSNKQPVQGFSAILDGPTGNSYYVMCDNGFGAKTNSADTLLRVYAMRPEFRELKGNKISGSGTVSPVDFKSGKTLSAFTDESFITLRDPGTRLGFGTVAGSVFYPNGNNDIPVDTGIQEKRLLTGADLDVESFRKDKHGNLWFGEEFGPFLVKTNAAGKVLRSEIPTPNIVPAGSTATGQLVMSPQNPYLGNGVANLGRSSGFEGMAINPAGDKLYTLLEGTVSGDNAINGSFNKNLRISEFDIDKERYTGKQWLYQLEAEGTNIGDMTAINDHQFIVIERNGGTATSGIPFKKLYLADIKNIAPGGFARKTELVDLMNIDDPYDLNGDGSTVFSFPFVTIEDVLILNARTLLVLNDNNYPGAGGRDLLSDNNEWIRVKLDRPLEIRGRRSGER